MTLEEVCKRFGVSESSMKKNFTRTSASIEKKTGCHIIKSGRGDKTIYEVQEPEEVGAITIYDEVNNFPVYFNTEGLRMQEWEFLTFLGILSRNNCMYRGTFQDFLLYLGLKPTAANIQNLKQALTNLEEEHKYIFWKQDPTAEYWFHTGLWRAVEKKYEIQLGSFKLAVELAAANNERTVSVVNMLKVWIAHTSLSSGEVEGKEEFYTLKDVETLTGLSAYQVRKANTSLEKAGVFKSESVYGDYVGEETHYRIKKGRKAIMNGFYNPISAKQREELEQSPPILGSSGEI